MPIDAQLPQPSTLESAAQPLWATLTRWMAPTSPATGDTALGYESALPWTLGDHAPSDVGPRDY